MNYRTGDTVLVEINATVMEAAASGRVRVRIGDVEIDTQDNTLTMIRRSIHVKDPVVTEDGVNARVTQSLEADILLLHVEGATGADAYRVADRGTLRHADDVGRAPAAKPAPAAVAQPTPAPQPAPAAPAAEPASAEGGAAADDTLELTPDMAPADEGDAAQDRSRVGAMGASLSGLVGGSREQRRQPINLENLGETDTVPAVRSEMVLGDDDRLGGRN